uniref:NADH-ubiquinone oxidoreductase chain 6 n=2 Tax=Microhylidae TaxID=8427 RepID=S4UZX0_9NEOB|nr:NADH dehydrogenase subunit 6 [Cophixalus sp. TNHC 54754]AVP25558.1 NADH dehydrogenase subunit 6 [Hylophorbus sp. TNHC-GDC 31221]
MVELCFLIGFLAVASNPSPYYAALGLVFGAGLGSLFLMKGGVTFLCLVLFLVYLGGMMVVFAYSAALVGEPYPEGWDSGGVLNYVGVYMMMLFCGGVVWFDMGFKVNYGGEYYVGHGEMLGEWWGVSIIFNAGGWVLFVGSWALLLTLVGVLEVVRGHYGGVLRAV